MVRISSTYIGVGNGKIGEGIYFVRMGETCARKYNKHINDANTGSQQIQRSNFNVALEFSRKVKDIYNIFWTSKLPRRVTRYNAFLSYTMQYALKLDSTGWQLDWQKVRFSSGTLPGFLYPSVINPSGQTISFSWQKNSVIGGAKSSDLFAFKFINLSTFKDHPKSSIIFGITDQNRSHQSFVCSLPSAWSGNEIAIYACFITPKLDKSSNSHYFTTLTLQ